MEETAESSPTSPEIDFSKLDPEALKVVRRLHQHGHQAYFVGGCVRDLLLDRQPKDFDIATSAHPGEVRDIFRNCRLIGRRFRLAHVYFKGGKVVEVATFRANPTEVEEAQRELELVAEVDSEGVAEVEADVPALEPTEESGDLLISSDNVFGSAEEDARRRDFTINGLFYDVQTGRVLDYVRGRRDLNERSIRTIGDPEVRMREDPVRILRAVRFACRLGLDIESRTYAAMEGAVEDLPRCAPPRLLEDTFRLLRGGVSGPAIRLLQALDALKYLLAPIDEFLKGHGPEGEKSFFAHADALDRRVLGGEKFEDAVLLAVLLLPLGQSEPDVEAAGGRPSVAKIVEDLLEELVKSARLPRRIAERCRMILFAQRTLSGERKRRGSLASFRRHPLFNESLAVFEISVEATGEFREQLEAWKSGTVPAVTGTAAEGAAEGSTAGRPKRRRRRGGRRPGGREGAEGASAEGGPSERSADGPPES